MKAIAVSFFISLVENIAVVLLLPALKSMALGVMLAASAFVAIINPANAATNDLTYYAIPVASIDQSNTTSHTIALNSKSINKLSKANSDNKNTDAKKNLSSNDNALNDNQQKYNRDKYNKVKQKIEMNRTLKVGEERRIGSGSYSS